MEYEDKTKDQIIKELMKLQKECDSLKKSFEKDITERKQVEKVLEDERNLLRTLINLLPSHIFIKDRESRFLIANLASAHFVGATSPDELIGKTDYDFYQSEVADDFRSDELDVLKGIPVVDKEEGSHSPGGTPRNLLTTKVPLRNAKGDIIGLVGTCLDITERKKAEEALRLNESLYQTIFESTGTATLIVEEDMTISMANHECFSLTGYSQAELIGEKWTKYVETESLQNMIRNHNLRRENPSLAPKKYEVKLIHKNGETRYAILDIGMVPGSRQSIVSILDITDHVKSTEAIKAKADELRLSEEKFKNVFEYAPVGKSMTSLDGTVHVNNAFCQLLGYTKKEMKDIHWRNFTYPDDIKRNDEIVNSILKGEKKTARWEKRFISKSGKIIWVDISTTILRDLNDVPLHFITTVIDITEKKESEEKIIQMNTELEKRVIERTSQLETANKELEAFAYSVSHDLRAPLRAIDGFSKFVLEDFGTKLEPEGKRLLNLIRSNTLKMDKLITDILALSKVSRCEHKVSKVDMKKMVLSMYNEIVSPEIQKKISFVVDEFPEAYADPAYIKQVWINLISNAIKFSSGKKKPEIKIGGYTEKGFHVYYVKDNGVGFNPEYSHKLFGVFQRLHKSDEFEGSGVGLAIVKRIVLRHEGQVWAEGIEGKGATFYFSLPVKRSG